MVCSPAVLVKPSPRFGSFQFLVRVCQGLCLGQVSPTIATPNSLSKSAPLFDVIGIATIFASSSESMTPFCLATAASSLFAIVWSLISL